jgi:hypothetical protein|tara:strand:- start:70 stop:246 length:177 start_codon:yes stop_codon:yes gene_type:complete
MKEVVEALANDPLFIQSLKDLQSLGFIKINKDDEGNYKTVDIIDREGLKNYMDNFGKP